MSVHRLWMHRVHLSSTPGKVHGWRACADPVVAPALQVSVLCALVRVQKGGIECAVVVVFARCRTSIIRTGIVTGTRTRTSTQTDGTSLAYTKHSKPDSRQHDSHRNGKGGECLEDPRPSRGPAPGRGSICTTSSASTAFRHVTITQRYFEPVGCTEPTAPDRVPNTTIRTRGRGGGSSRISAESRPLSST